MKILVLVLVLVLVLPLCLAAPAWAGLHTDWDPQRKVRGWILDQDGLHLELRQIEPDRARAFFAARGFPKPLVERLARACPFQTVVRNQGPAPITLDRHQWRLDGDRPLRLKDDWLTWLRTRGAPGAALIAFRWGTFPTRQTFAPGDYNWGLTLFDRPPGSRFDLRLRWRAGQDEREAVIGDLQCIDAP